MIQRQRTRTARVHAMTFPAAAIGLHRRCRTVFGVLVVVYLVSGIGLLPLYRHQLNPDGVSYLTIAAHYAHGQWGEVVNGVWSPMLSWLLALPIGWGAADPLLAARVVNLGAGLLALAGMWVLTDRYTTDLRLRTAGAAALMPVLLAWSFQLITPDLLVVAVLLWYLVALTARGYDVGGRHAVLAGVLGGVAYLTKAYALPLVLIHLTVWHLWRARGAAEPAVRRAWWRRLALAMLSCLVIAGPWVVLVSLKHGHLTHSTAMDYNWRLIGPQQGDVHPTYRPGLLDPTGPHATSAWEDPSALAMPEWSALDQPEYFARLVADNIATTLAILQRSSLLALPMAVATALATRHRHRLLTAAERRLLGMTSLALAALPAGYLVVRVEARYLWLASPLLILLGLLIIDAVARRGVLARGGFVLAIGSLVASFWLPAARDLWTERHVGAADAPTSTALRRHAPDIAAAPIASNTEPRTSLYLAYLTSARYYGLAPATPDEAARQLADRHIALECSRFY